MNTTALREEVTRLCEIGGKNFTNKRDFCELAYEDASDEKTILKNVKIIDSTDNVGDLIDICNNFKRQHRPNEILQFVGPSDVDTLFAQLPEEIRTDVRFDFLSYFRFFRSAIGVDFTTYLEKQRRTWAEHCAQFPKHIPVRLYRRDDPLHKHTIDDYVHDYLRDDQEINLDICYGEYGVGKTTFVLELENSLTTRYFTNPSENRIPIRVPLIEYRKASQIEDLIRRTITEPNDPFTTDEVFWRLVEAGRFVFLLDGVDEMFDLGTSEQLQRRQLKELLRLQFQGGNVQDGYLLHRARTLWTCRTTFFDSYEEIGKDREIGEVLERIPHKKDLFVSTFDSAKVQEQIEQESPELWALVQRIFGLKALAQTALWFQMVLKNLFEKIKKGETIVSTRLLDDFIEAAILQEESEKKRSFDRAKHEIAIEWLACTIHALRHAPGRKKGAKVGLMGRDIAELLLQYAQENKLLRNGFDDLLKFQYEMERLFQAVRFCSFLSRYDTDDVGYYFYPEPFESYFVAMRLCKKDFKDQKLSIKSYFSTFKEFPVSEGVCHFLYDEFTYQEATNTISERLLPTNENGWTIFPSGLFVYWDSENSCDFVESIDSFGMLQHPVTVREYREFLSSNLDVAPPPDWDGEEYRRFCPSEECPVVRVSFEEAERYCQWLSDKEGCKVCLPTDRQWQRAARGIDGRFFHWGMSLPNPVKDLCNTLEHWDVIAQARTTPVGSFRHKPFDIADLIGNVWEYTRETAGERVLTRGASFHTGKDKWKLSRTHPDEECKLYIEKGQRRWDIGFRPVKLIGHRVGTVEY